jgi:hypothetical protein
MPDFPGGLFRKGVSQVSKDNFFSVMYPIIEENEKQPAQSIQKP